MTLAGCQLPILMPILMQPILMLSLAHDMSGAVINISISLQNPSA